MKDAAPRQRSTELRDVAAQFFSLLDSASYRKPGNLITGLYSDHSPPAGKAQSTGHVLKSRHRKLDLHFRTDRRAFRCENEHAAQSDIPRVPGIVVLFAICAIGPMEQNGHQDLKPAKGPAID